MVPRAKKVDFEQSMAALEELVEKMENGDFSLEESVKQFERGVALARACQQALKDAEQKVQQLVSSKSGQDTLETFEQPDDDSSSQ